LTATRRVVAFGLITACGVGPGAASTRKPTTNIAKRPQELFNFRLT
jgi:hypothetical protein